MSDVIIKYKYIQLKENEFKWKLIENDRTDYLFELSD